MKTTNRLALACAIVVVLLAASILSATGRRALGASTPPPVQYKVVSTGTRETSAAILQTILVQNGGQRWILVQTYQSESDVALLIFRR